MVTVELKFLTEMGKGDILVEHLTKEQIGLVAISNG